MESMEHPDSKPTPFGLPIEDIAEAYKASADRPDGMPRHVAYLHRVEGEIARRHLATSAGLMPVVREYEELRQHAETMAIAMANLCSRAKTLGVDTTEAERLVQHHVWSYVQGGD